jgi:hypothetical protein
MKCVHEMLCLYKGRHYKGMKCFVFIKEGILKEGMIKEGILKEGILKA